MNVTQYITIFVALAILIGVGTLVVAISYDSITLPDSVVTTEGTPAVLPTTPDELSGLIAWYEADDSSTISIGVGVSQWDDKSGQFNNVTQATGTLQPVVTTDAINGKDAITFDGNGDYLHISSFTGGSEAMPNTIIMVVKPDSRTGGNYLYIDGGASTTRQSIGQYTTNDNYIFQAGGLWDTGVLRNTGWQALYGYFENPLTYLYENKTAHGNGIAGTQSMDGVTLAGRYDGQLSNSAQISIAEVIVYDRQLNATEFDEMHDYIEYHYDLGMTLVGNYTEGTESTVSTGWTDVQTTLDTQAQSATALLVITLIVLAAAVVVFVARRMNQ